MKPTLNLASRAYVNRRLLYASYALGGALLLTVLTISGGYLWNSRQTTSDLQTRIADLDRQIDTQKGRGQVEHSPEDTKKLLARIDFANEVIRKDTFRWTALLSKLEGVVPEGVGLLSIRPDFKAGGLNIVGMARNLESLQDFLDRLLASPDFSAVLLLSQSRLDAKVGMGSQALQFSLALKGAF